ncbi:MAG TPA: hypothetical protein VKU41_12785 [Polyangiaceae bacterium]|nr:hypothetical protein [Polyangiaceae bacterium]
MAIESVRSVPLRVPETDRDVRLRISGLRHSEQSFEVRMFFGTPPRGGSKDHERFIGSFFMYGLGRARAGEAHPHTAPWDMTVPVSRAALHAARSAGAHGVSFALVDSSGSPLPGARLDFDDVGFETGAG